MAAAAPVAQAPAAPVAAVRAPAAAPAPAANFLVRFDHRRAFI